MRLWLSIYGVLYFGLFAQAQVDTVFLAGDSIVGLEQLRQKAWFYTGEGLPHVDRVSTYISEVAMQDLYFYFAVVLSGVFAFVVVSSKEIVLSSWRSFFRLQHQIQYSRSDKSGNLIFLLLYVLLFVVVISVLLSFIMQTFWTYDVYWWQLMLACFLYFVWDYFSANLYYLFAGNRKTIDALKYMSLSYAPLWSILAWLTMFFVLFTSPEISKYIAVLLFSFFGFSILLKEIRALQILWGEKVDVISIHFFAYLCTFKILPFVLIVRLIV